MSTQISLALKPSQIFNLNFQLYSFLGMLSLSALFPLSKHFISPWSRYTHFDSMALLLYSCWIVSFLHQTVKVDKMPSSQRRRTKVTRRRFSGLQIRWSNIDITSFWIAVRLESVGTFGNLKNGDTKHPCPINFHLITIRKKLGATWHFYLFYISVFLWCGCHACEPV